MASIRKYRNGWRCQPTINGKRVSFTGKTKKEVEEKVAIAKAEAIKGDYVHSNNITVEEWINYWLETVRQHELSEQTFIKYRSNFDNHIIPAVGHIKLQDLTRDQLQQMYVEVFHEKNTDKDYEQKTYSHDTVNSISVQFKKCLKFAVEEGKIKKNPHEGVKLHKLREPRKINPFTIEEQRKIVEYCKSSRLDWIFYFIIATGLRFGEAVALTWDDVDLINKTVDINKTSVEYHGVPTIQEDKTKTRSSKRKIAIADNVVEFLKMVKESQDPKLNYRNLVITNRNYNIITNANTNNRFRRVCAILDIEYRSMHNLRHTWATRCLEKGIDVKTVSKMLGHKSVVTTMDTYQHVLPSLQEQTVAKLNDLF